MDTQSDDIQREIAAQRQQIGEKVANLRNRLNTDRSEAQIILKRRASRAGKLTLTSLALVAGMFSLGMALSVGYLARRRRNSRSQDTLIIELDGFKQSDRLDLASRQKP